MTHEAAASPEPPHPWSDAALLAKSQRYVEIMLELPRDDWRFALWSSLTLELLARAALSRISPTHLADCSKNWDHLYYSLGHKPTSKKFVPSSIAVTEVLSRLGALLPDFDTELEGFCRRHIASRNSELHSGDTPFDSVPHSSWLPDFYRACEVLLASLETDLSQFVGEQEAEVASKLMEAAADKAAKAVEGTIDAHRRVWSDKASEERDELSERAALWASRHIGHRVVCPACGCRAIVTGEAISPPTQALEEDLIVERQQHLPNKFECIACGLKLSGLSHLNAAGLADAFTSTQTYDPAEYYAPADEWGMWEEDNNERF